MRVDKLRHFIAVKYRGGIMPISNENVEVGCCCWLRWSSDPDSEEMSDEVRLTMDVKEEMW